jgi:hypothetical protein
MLRRAIETSTTAPDRIIMAERPGKPRSLGDLLSRGPEAAGLRRLAEAAGERLALLDYLRSGLAAELQPALAGCNLQPDGTLVLTAVSPAWTARLRFEGPALLARCREHHPEAARVRVRTRVG